MMQLNDTKTEAMSFGMPSQLKNCPIDSFKIGESNIIPSQNVKNIGLILDPQLHMKHHINMITSNAWYHIKNIYKIRKYLNNKTAEKLVHRFWLSKLDLYNNLLYGLTKTSISKLQRVLNSAAKLITGVKKYDHVTDIL